MSLRLTNIWSLTYKSQKSSAVALGGVKRVNPDCRELLYRIQRLADSPRLYPLKKL